MSVLFVCTGNACRSQMAEAILRDLAGDRFEALSAGTRPAGFVHPLALKTLTHLKISTDGLESKHYEKFVDRPIDICITVCDNASAECPTWIGGTTQAHWPMPDPAFFQGTEEERDKFCIEVALRIKQKIEALTKLPLHSLPKHIIAQHLESLGRKT